MRGKSRRVLVVLQDHDQRLRLSSLLARQGHKVQAVADTSTAGTVLRSTPPEIIVYDAILLVDTAHDLCRLLKNDALYQTLPVLVIGNRPGSQERRAALDAGADEFIESTASDGELLALVEDLVSIRDVAEHLDIGIDPVVEAFSRRGP